MKKILVLCLICFLTQCVSEAKDYTKLHIKEMKKGQKYSASNNYFTDYAPVVENKSKVELKDPKLIKCGEYEIIPAVKYDAKLAKDKAEYAKIQNFLLSRKVDNYNTQAYGEDFYKLYRITERIIRANNLDFINWRIVVDVDESFNASSSDTNCITINTGAYDTFSNNEDALALLIGHELAHSLLGHGARKGDLIKSIEKAERINNYWYHLYRRKNFLSESRKMEFAADAEGAKLALKAGYNLEKGREMLSFLSTLSNRADTYSTHPSPKERLKSFEQNKRYFLDEEWVNQGKYNIYNSQVLECQKSSDRNSIVIARSNKKNLSTSYQPESVEQLYLRFGYTSYLNGEFDKSIDYFKKYLGADKSNYAVYLYISYAYEALYKETSKDGYLDAAKEFAGFAKTLAPDNKYVKEQILSL